MAGVVVMWGSQMDRCKLQGFGIQGEEPGLPSLMERTGLRRAGERIDGRFGR